MRLRSAVCEQDRIIVLDSWGFVRDLKHYEEVKEVKKEKEIYLSAWEDVEEPQVRKVKRDLISPVRRTDNKRNRPCKYRKIKVDRYAHLYAEVDTQEEV